MQNVQPNRQEESNAQNAQKYIKVDGFLIGSDWLWRRSSNKLGPGATRPPPEVPTNVEILAALGEDLRQLTHL